MTLTGDGGKTVKNTLYDESALGKKDQYAYFLGGNRPLVEIHTGADTGKSLLLLKDSYAHCFVPFLTGHFDTIWVVDLRYFKEDVSQWMTGRGITDLLVLYNAVTFSQDAALESMLTG